MNHKFRTPMNLHVFAIRTRSWIFISFICFGKLIIIFSDTYTAQMIIVLSEYQQSNLSVECECRMCHTHLYHLKFTIYHVNEQLKFNSIRKMFSTYTAELVGFC